MSKTFHIRSKTVHITSKTPHIKSKTVHIRLLKEWISRILTFIKLEKQGLCVIILCERTKFKKRKI